MPPPPSRRSKEPVKTFLIMRVRKNHEGERGPKGNGAAVCVGLGSALCQVVQGRLQKKKLRHLWTVVLPRPRKFVRPKPSYQPYGYTLLAEGVLSVSVSDL